MDAKTFLPQYKLAQLTDRVAMQIDYFSRIFKPENIWDFPIELCSPIELNPANVSEVILKAKKEDGIVVAGTTIRKHHTILTCIYILLYFKHCDDKVYEATVFPQLKRNMGSYAEEKILKNKIQIEIKKILEEEKLIKEALGTNDLDIKDAAIDMVKTKQINELQEKVAQLKSELADVKAERDKATDELKNTKVELEALKYETAEKEKANINVDDLDAEKELSTFERIIFFSSALRLNINDKTKNQRQLARLVYRMKSYNEEDKEKKIENIRTYVNKLASMMDNDQYSDTVLQAAQNVIVYLTNCCKKNVTDEKAELNDVIEDIISDIEKVYHVSAPVKQS